MTGPVTAGAVTNSRAALLGPSPGVACAAVTGMTRVSQSASPNGGPGTDSVAATMTAAAADHTLYDADETTPLSDDLYGGRSVLQHRKLHQTLTPEQFSVL